MASSSIHFREVPVSGHVFRKARKSGDRWMAKWRDAEGQHQVVLGRVWTKRGRPPEGYLTKQGAQRARRLRCARRSAANSRAASPKVTVLERRGRLVRLLRLASARIASSSRLLPEFGSATLESITTQRIDAWRSGLVAAGLEDGEALSARTINKYLGVMQSILKRAQRVYGLAANAAAWAERQPVTRSGDFNVLSAPEVEALARAAREGRHRKPPKHSYVMRTEGVPKSGRVRSVPMIDQVAVALDQLSRRPAWTGDDDLVFVNPAGEHIEDSALRRRFYAALKAADLKHLRFHDLRHSFGTLAVQVFPLTDVKAYMGHATSRRR